MSRRGVNKYSPLIFTVPSGPVEVVLPEGVTGQEVEYLGRWIESHGRLLQQAELEARLRDQPKA